MHSCKSSVATVWHMPDQPSNTKTGGITKTGVKKTLWFHADAAEALRRAAFEMRMKESEIIRTAVRRFLKIED